jgi:hypothetical protein
MLAPGMLHGQSRNRASDACAPGFRICPSSCYKHDCRSSSIISRHCAAGCSDAWREGSTFSGDTTSRRSNSRLQLYEHPPFHLVYRYHPRLSCTAYCWFILPWSPSRQDSCGGNKFFFPPESPAKRLLVAAEQAEVLACIPMPMISQAESCGICLFFCCRISWTAVLSSPCSREPAGGPALRSLMNKMVAGGLL